ncbi:DEAD/DEAH box helicase [Maridesulfovibrio zosterae]|uniref:DEAD/DEAH box helicase n=1 Tax=Maridesulfovibrio zosterae TaxID=82171 RepID=UPI0003F9EAEB|nr:DEAD/DEAH box helicase [Maridesulfovibrio zosterae]
MTKDETFETIVRLLEHEHKAIAYKLGVIASPPEPIPYDLIKKSIAIADRLSRRNSDRLKQIVLTICALLWTYCNESCSGLSETLILFLSRIGFSPSSGMVDPGYEGETYSAQQSIINQHAIMLHQLRCEVEIGEQKFVLTEFQKEFWKALDTYKLVGISAPTSAGKSYAILLKCIDLLINKSGIVIYIVPTLSLVAQVSADFRDKLDFFGLHDYPILTTYNDQHQPSKAIYVLTQEKAVAAFAQNEVPFSEVRIFVVDEIQNIERVGNEGDVRSKILFDAITEIRFSCNPDYVVISGPRVEGLGHLGIDLFGIEADEQEAKSSPVASVTYAFAEKNGSYIFKQYHELLHIPNELHIENDQLVKGFGQKRYTDNFHGYLNEVLDRLGKESKNIVFAPTAQQARKTAIAIATGDNPPLNGNINSLVDYIKKTVHPLYDLAYTVSRGIAFHHGQMPLHVRRTIESAVCDKMISNVVCTTTLMQGVNLPAQNVIIRSPNLFIAQRDGATKLTNYELANLRGRAGRLLKDFIGRTFILDETFFSQPEDQYDLLQDESKEVSAGYSDKFDLAEIDICNSLRNCEPYSDTDFQHNFLLTYIRHGIVRYKEMAPYRFKQIGIEIDPETYAKAVTDLSSLTISPEICLKNRYWDPLDLQEIASKISKISLPINLHDKNAAKDLCNVLKFMKYNFTHYCERYYDLPPDNVIFVHSINAIEWARETPLYNILSTEYHSDADKIDNTIKTILTKISYDIPALLKPLYDIKFGDSPFLRAIECGAYRPVTRFLIENNVPRDTAISLTDNFFSDVKDEFNPLQLKNFLLINKKDIPHWEFVQLKGFLY